jgi:cytoskeleton protein RodZ
MNTESTFQETLFADPLGLRFRHLREKARWSKESVAQQLKLPTAVIDAIEREDWARLGAPIYVRSYVGSYAKLLGLPAELAEDIIRDKPAPELIYNGGNSGARQMLDRSVRNVAYLLMTVAIVGSVVMLVMHFQAPAKVAQLLPLDPPAATSQAPATTTRESASSSAGSGITTPATATSSLPTNPTLQTANPSSTDAPVMASLTPSLPAANVTGNDLVLKFRQESWIDVLDSNGQRVERGLVAAGSERHFAAGQVSHITLGNAEVVEVMQGGQLVDTAPFREANVARFSLSSQGNIAPPGG